MEEKVQDSHSRKVRYSVADTFHGWMHYYEHSGYTLQIIASLVIGAVILLLILRLLRGSRKGKAVFFMGISESGKTRTFSKLCHDKEVISVTSIKESSGFCTVKQKQALLYDIPGHERIRYNIFERVKSQVRAIIFLIDSTSFQKDLRDVAEYLYNILCDGTVQKQVRYFLIACNKQDLPAAKGARVLQASLEKEMNLLRVTKASQLQSVGGTRNNNNFLGRTDEDFEFKHLYPMKVSFAEVSAAEGQLEDIRNWLFTVV